MNEGIKLKAKMIFFFKLIQVPTHYAIYYTFNFIDTRLKFFKLKFFKIPLKLFILLKHWGYSKKRYTPKNHAHLSIYLRFLVNH